MSFMVPAIYNHKDSVTRQGWIFVVTTEYQSYEKGNQ